MLFCDTSITTISRGTEQSREDRNLCVTTGRVIALPPNMWKCIQHKGPHLKSKSWYNAISIGSMKPTNLILLIELRNQSHPLYRPRQCLIVGGKISDPTNIDNPFKKNTLLI